MQQEAKTEPTEVCPKCGKLMEPIHFSNDPAGLLVYHGPPPAGLLGQLAQLFTGSLVRTESGSPVLFGFDRGYQVPGMHCKHCRQITIRYSP
jgi:hypothetical protein